jgi:hypothetical protein
MLATDTGSPSQDCCMARGHAADGQSQRLDLGDLKTILVPLQALLKRLDPTGELLVQTVRTQLQPLVRQYERLVIQDRLDDDRALRDALKIYNYFHRLNRVPEWGEIALRCTCRVCFGKCMCKHSLLFVLLFKPEVRVPGSWITATPSLRKCASPSRELSGAGDYASLRRASATKRALNQMSRSCRAPPPPPFRPAGRIPALLMSSVSLPSSCRLQHCPSLAMMTSRLRYV